MYLIDALNVLLRRWYVVLVGLLLMAGGAAAVFAYVPTTYQASGQVLLLLPAGASGTEQPLNPYLNLQAGLTTAASVVAGAVATKDAQREIADQGFESEYAVALVPGTGPLITVTTTDEDPAMAVATRDAVMTWMDGELRNIQTDVNVPSGQYIHTSRSSVSSQAEALPGSKLRALVGVAALGGVLTLAATFGLDRLLARRRGARRPQAPVRLTKAQLEVADEPEEGDGDGSRRRRRRAAPG